MSDESEILQLKNENDLYKSLLEKERKEKADQKAKADQKENERKAKATIARRKSDKKRYNSGKTTTQINDLNTLLIDENERLKKQIMNVQCLNLQLEEMHGTNKNNNTLFKKDGSKIATQKINGEGLGCFPCLSKYTEDENEDEEDEDEDYILECLKNDYDYLRGKTSKAHYPHIDNFISCLEIPTTKGEKIKNYNLIIEHIDYYFH